MAATSAKPTILIVEDEAGPRNALRVILRPFFHIHSVDTGHAAMQLLKELPVDLVTLDLKLSDRQGIDLLQEIKQERPDVGVIIITGYGSLKSAMDGFRHGAAGYMLKPFNVTELITLINQTLEKKQRLGRLREFLRDSTELWGTDQGVATAWKQLKEQGLFLSPEAKQEVDPHAIESAECAQLFSDLLEAKNRDLCAHSTRVSFYATLLANQLSLSVAEQKVLALGSLLHDIGTIGLDDRMLSVPGRLNDRDEEAFKRHPEIGARMILPFQMPAEVGQVILYHHESYDGSGYPHGLQGEGIPLLARIVSVVQTFDHLVAGQPDHPALLLEEAGEQLRRQAGSRLDPALAGLFSCLISDNKVPLPALAMSSKAAALPKS
jgi:putative nucleotidyltransferase with HDIG domain